MKKIIYTTLALAFMTVSFTSCRDENPQTEKEKLIQEMKDDGAEMKVKTDGDETKIKMETDEKSVKIKEDGGDTKIKVETKD